LTQLPQHLQVADFHTAMGEAAVSARLAVAGVAMMATSKIKDRKVMAVSSMAPTMAPCNACSN
jgi:hypothetical protein